METIKNIQDIPAKTHAMVMRLVVNHNINPRTEDRHGITYIYNNSTDVCLYAITKLDADLQG